MRTLLRRLVLSSLCLLAASPCVALEPSLEEPRAGTGDMVTVTASGNPVVDVNANLASPSAIRAQLTQTARWIVSDDLDGDGRGEAVVLFESGTLEFFSLDRENLRSKASVRGLSPEAPPVVIREFGGEPYGGVLAVDGRGNLLVLQMEGTRTRTLASGVSSLTSPLVGDLDGDGSSEVVAVNDEGRLLLLGRDNQSLTEPKVELLPDTRLTMADADGDGRVEVMAFSRPSKDFAFGRLGDDVEATAIAAFSWNGKFLTAVDELVLPKGEAFECLVPIVAPLDAQGSRVLTTVSSEEEGSRILELAFGRGKFREDRKGPIADGKSLILAVGAGVLGDTGRPSVLAVSSPEGNGTLEGFRAELTMTRPRLERRISVLRGTVRSAGMALIGDVDADRQLELMAPSDDRKALRIFEFEANGIRSRDVHTGGKPISSNLCPGDFNGDGRLDVMFGIEDGGFVILSGR